MFVVIVNAHAKEESLQSFINATLDNAKNSIKEPGILRFDFYQQADDPTRFTLIEIYNSEEDPLHHRGTVHYNRWKDAVETMLVEPRTKTSFNILFPSQIEK
jgi:quinol monooxygenase YgiN